MERLSVIVVLCLLVGLSECQAGGESSETQITVLTHEDLAENLAENNESKVFNQGPETAACEPTINVVLRELGALGERLAATVKALEETTRRLEASENQVAALNSTVTKLRRMNEDRPRVAFSVVTPKDGTIGPVNIDHPLVFRIVLSNIGNAYSPISGYFTAPVRGVYHFTFTAFDWGVDRVTGGSLCRNGERMVSWYDQKQSESDSSSNSATLLLQVGDQVNVVLWAGAVISDNVNRYSSFSGFLVFPM